MNIEDKIAYTEVLEILNKMEDKYINKIPKEVINIFRNNRLEDYDFKINTRINLKDQKLSKKTLAVLAMLNLKYWCESEKEKEELMALYISNEKRYQEELLKKYNPDDLFKKNKRENINKVEEVIEPEKIEEKWYNKILNKIKRK